MTAGKKGAMEFEEIVKLLIIIVLVIILLLLLWRYREKAIELLKDFASILRFGR